MLGPVLTCLAIALAAGPALAADASGVHSQALDKATYTNPAQQNQRKQPARAEVNISPAQAARAARNVYGGKVLRVILETDTKPPYYRVKLLNDGRLHMVRVAAHR